MGGYVGALKGAAGQAESAWVRDSRLLHAGIQLMVLSWSWVSLLRYFSTLGSEIFLLVDGWKSFSMQGYSLRSIPCRGCYNWLIFFYLRVVISAGGWKFFLHAGIPCSISILSRVTLSFSMDGWKPLLGSDRVSLPAGWYFLPLGSKYFCWWMVGNPFLYYAGIQSTASPVESVCQLDDIFLPLGSKYSSGGWKSFY
jgi:hypothetical protein